MTLCNEGVSISWSGTLTLQLIRFSSYLVGRYFDHFSCCCTHFYLYTLYEFIVGLHWIRPQSHRPRALSCGNHWSLVGRHANIGKKLSFYKSFHSTSDRLHLCSMLVQHKLGVSSILLISFDNIHYPLISPTAAVNLHAGMEDVFFPNHLSLHEN